MVASTTRSPHYTVNVLEWVTVMRLYPGFDDSSYYMFFFLIYFLPYVLGHGYVASVSVGGSTYPGWNPFVDRHNADTPSRIVRKVANDGFVARGEVDMACHHGGNEGTSAIAKDAQSGSNITFHWAYWPDDHLGPVSTYMTLCVGGCSNFSANDAQWFKIDAVGYDPVSKWASSRLIRDNLSWTSTIPAGLKPGEYLVRNEIAAFHSVGTPQFYPSCSQINVVGSGTHFPTARNMVSMQQLYDVKFKAPNIYTDTFDTFTFPGPPRVNFDGNDGESTSTSRIYPQPSSQCRLRRRSG